MQWSYNVAADGATNFHGSILIDRDRIVVGTDGPRAHVYAFRIESGELIWKYPSGRGISTDLLAKDSRLFGVGQTDEGGYLVCLEMDDGTEVWKTDLGAAGGPPFVLNKSPELVEDRLVYGGADGFLHSFSTDTGDRVWSRDFGVGSAIVTPVVFHRDGLFFGTESGMLYVADPVTGALMGEMALDGKPHGPPTPVGDLLVLFVNWSVAGSEMVALDPGIMETRWRHGSPGSGFWISARPRVWKGTLLGGDSEGRILAIHPEDGTWAWSYGLEGTAPRIFGGLDDWLYMGTIDGTLYAFQQNDR